jgi:transposase
MVAKRYELTDEQWARLAPLLPASRGPGRPCHDHRRMLNGMLWVVRSGAPWRDLPERYGKFKTVHARFTRWRRDGTWDHVVEGLQSEMEAEGLLDWKLWCVDGSNVRAARCAAGADKKGGPQTNRQTTPWGGREGASERSCTL